MNISRINIEEKLNQKRSSKINPDSWKSQIERIFKNDELHNDRIELALESENSLVSNAFDIDFLETSKIYHLDQIKDICIDYRLRFLDSKYFKAKLPNEAIFKIKELEKKHKTEIKGFKIMAPSKLFKLENADDPLLFAPIGNDYYYLIHKWGNELHPLRKYSMWFFKCFENLIFLIFLISILCTLLIPNGLFNKEENPSLSIYFMEFMFVFKSVAAVVLYYGFASGKNFNNAIWNSKYYNA